MQLEKVANDSRATMNMQDCFEKQDSMCYGNDSRLNNTDG